MKRVITYGTFDMFHYGHYNLLKRASQLGDVLYVGVSSDKMCAEKGKVTVLDEVKRMKIVGDLKFVNEVFLEHDMPQKVRDCQKYKIDIFVLGSDYKTLFPNMKEYRELLEIGVEVVFLERTPDISSTELKEKAFLQAKMDEEQETLHILTSGH